MPKRKPPDTAKDIKLTPEVKAHQPGGKLGVLVDMITAPGGANLAALIAATGWQAHSVRGATAGALKVRYALNISSENTPDGRVYKIKQGAAG